MEKTSMPANISYTLLVHGGSYKNFQKKMATDFPHLLIKEIKQKAVHYYIVMVTEDGQEAYKKEDIYKLPIMAMREEFSNYLFFKKIAAYNNALKFMCRGLDNKEAPYELYQEMLTPFEKMKYAEIDNNTKQITLEEVNNTTVSYFGTSIFGTESVKALFEKSKVKVDNKEYNFVELLKEQKLLIGIL